MVDHAIVVVGDLNFGFSRKQPDYTKLLDGKFFSEASLLSTLSNMLLV